MFHKNSEKGQALIIIALAAIGLFAFSALAIDGTRTFSNKRHAQNAADTAVLAAALAKAKGLDYTTAALTRATSNGYTNDANTTVQVNLCSEAGVTCEGLPTGATASEYIRVRVVSSIPTTFGRILGRQTLIAATEAIAHVTLGGTPGAGGPYFGGAAMMSTKGGNNNQCLLMNGGADLYTHNSGISINCSGSQAWFMNGNATLNMDAPGRVVGCYFQNGSVNWNPTTDPINCGANGGVSQTINADTFEDVPTTLPAPTCSSNGSVSGDTYYPGKFTNITINSNKTAIFTPGVYCISGNLNLNGNATMSGPNGRVQIVLQDQSINLNGGSTITFNDLEIYGRNASFTLNGGAIFRATRFRFFSTGSGMFTVNGSSELSSSNSYAYLYRGDLVWNGNSTLNLHTPPAGDPFSGLVIYKPWGNTDQLTLNGGSNIHLTGTFLVPSSEVVFNGGVDFELHSQIIASTYIVNGNADVDIYYVADENYRPPTSPDAVIQLTK